MIWSFFTGSRVGRWIGVALTAIATVLGVYLAGKRDGAQRAAEKSRKADQQNAKSIEERADEALRRHDGDSRPVDERLHERGRLRDGD